MEVPRILIYGPAAIALVFVGVLAFAFRGKSAQRVIFEMSMACYGVGLVYTTSMSLSVPPEDVPIWLAMVICAVCALFSSKSAPRKWQFISAAALVFAIAGTIFCVLAGRHLVAGVTH